MLGESLNGAALITIAIVVLSVAVGRRAVVRSGAPIAIEAALEAEPV